LNCLFVYMYCFSRCLNSFVCSPSVTPFFHIPTLSPFLSSLLPLTLPPSYTHTHTPFTPHKLPLLLFQHLLHFPSMIPPYNLSNKLTFLSLPIPPLFFSLQDSGFKQMKITSLFSAKAPSLVAGLQGLNMEPVQSPVQVPSGALMIGMCVVYILCACVCVYVWLVIFCRNCYYRYN
jgi:hypothetical protein